MQLKKDLEKANKELEDLQKSQKMLKEEVDEEDIAQIVSHWTGIPVTRMMESEMQKLIHLEETLRQRVISQDEALEKVSKRRTTFPRRIARCESSDRLIHIPGTHWSGKN